MDVSISMFPIWNMDVPPISQPARPTQYSSLADSLGTDERITLPRIPSSLWMTPVEVAASVTRILSLN